MCLNTDEQCTPPPLPGRIELCHAIHNTVPPKKLKGQYWRVCHTKCSFYLYFYIRSSNVRYLKKNRLSFSTTFICFCAVSPITVVLMLPASPIMHKCNKRIIFRYKSIGISAQILYIKNKCKFSALFEALLKDKQIP